MKPAIRVLTLAVPASVALVSDAPVSWCAMVVAWVVVVLAVGRFCGAGECEG